jgi:hypothetical protein
MRGAVLTRTITSNERLLRDYARPNMGPGLPGYRTRTPRRRDIARDAWRAATGLRPRSASRFRARGAPIRRRNVDDERLCSHTICAFTPRGPMIGAIHRNLQRPDLCFLTNTMSVRLRDKEQKERHEIEPGLPPHGHRKNCHVLFGPWLSFSKPRYNCSKSKILFTKMLGLSTV